MTFRLFLFFVFLFGIPVPAFADCSTVTMGNKSAGYMFYNASQKVFAYCDGTDWIAMNPRGSGSGGCSNPTKLEGQMVYSADNHVLQGCAGNVWRAMGPEGGGTGGAWAAVDAGGNHVCGLTIGGAIYCWGYDGQWQLGNGTNKNDKQSPTQEATESTNWIDVSSSAVHTCAIKDDGTLWCWGGDHWGFGGGYMGQGGTGWSGESTATQEVTDATDWAQVSAGNSHTCAIKTGGELYCWGSANTTGELGLGDFNDTGTPTQVGTDTDWAQVSAASAGNHTCAIKTGGTLWCWGDDSQGQLGDDAPLSNQNSPAQVGTDIDWAQVSAAGSRTCAVKTNGELYCWGYDTNYQGSRLGCGACGDQSTPYKIGTDTDWKQVSANYDHSCAVKTDGRLYCWGIDFSDALGNGETEGSKNVPFQEQTSAANWDSVSVGYEFTCAMKTDRTRWCWGSDENGRLGDGGAAGNQYSPVQEASGANDWASAEEMAQRNSCAIKTDGTLWCWGDDIDNQLGCGGCGRQDAPLQIGADTNWAQVNAGGNYPAACGVKTDGTLWCWGSDYSQVLGNGPGTTHEATPAQVGSDSNWKQVVIGNWHACATKTNGTLWCWGGDGGGELGNGAGEGAKDAPFQVGTDTDWNQVSTTDEYWSATCATKTNGTLWCWGIDDYTNLPCAGCGTNQQSPVQVGTDTDWKEIAAMARGACVLKTGGTLWCWGLDSSGKLGNGSGQGDKTAPFQVGTDSDWDKISAAGYVVCAIKTNYDLYCWGNGDSGQIGNGATGSQQSPALVGSGWKNVAVSGSATQSNHVCAVTMANALYCWGDNLYGQLGAGLPTTDIPLRSTVCVGDYLEGSIIYNSSKNIMQYCDGNGWVGIGKTP